MSKRQQAIKLVEELLELRTKVEQKELELDQLLGEKPKRQRTQNSEDPDSSKARILAFMKANRGRSLTVTDVCKGAECTNFMFSYHMRTLVEEKKVKRVKRGHYQVIGRKS
jgi:hypothetical protein